MYIRTSTQDRKEFSKILARELLKKFTPAVMSLEYFYVKKEDFEKIEKLYKLKMVDSVDRLVGANQVVNLKSDGKLEVEGLSQFGCEQDVLKFLELFKDYFGSFEVVSRIFYINYQSTSKKSLNSFASHLHKKFNISSHFVAGDLVGSFGNIMFYVTKGNYSDLCSLRFKTNFFKADEWLIAELWFKEKSCTFKLA